MTSYALTPGLLTLARKQGGVFTSAQAYAHGYTPKELQRLRGRTIVNLRRGVYADRAGLAGLDERSAHVVAIRAGLLALDRPTVVSHVSAAVLHGLPLLTPELTLIHVTRPELHASRLEAGIHHHAAALPEDDLVRVDSVECTGLPRTGIDIARETSFASGVAALDAILRRGVPREDLAAAMIRCMTWPGARGASRALDFADGAAENPGESLSRVVLRSGGLPAPLLQVDIADADGHVGRVDFLWRAWGVVGEFDGRHKYRVPVGADPEAAGEVVWREKRREDRLRGLGFEVVRWTYRDLTLGTPEQLAGRIRAAAARGARAGMSA